jgi:hypothetical protein
MATKKKSNKVVCLNEEDKTQSPKVSAKWQMKHSRPSTKNSHKTSLDSQQSQRKQELGPLWNSILTFPPQTCTTTEMGLIHTPQTTFFIPAVRYDDTVEGVQG